MKDKTRRLPAPEGSLPAFDPVPRRRPRHDGWTPERQQAFVAALADTGCVRIAARMVNMSAESAYMLRRQPGAESFRRAWDAAQSLGLQVVKDEAFDRAMHGQLVPVFVAGQLMGFRRKKNDRLLMFILRHYGQDASGRKTTINYFSTRATAGAAAAAAAQDSPSPLVGEGLGRGVGGETAAAAAESSTTVKTIISGDPGQGTALAIDTEAADLVNAFEGVPLDDQARDEIHRALEAAAERRRALRTDWDTPRDERLRREAADVECDFIRVEPASTDYLGELEPGVAGDDFEPFKEGEPRWESIGEAPPPWYAQWLEGQEAKAALPAPENPPQPVPAEAAREDGAQHDEGGLDQSTEHEANDPPISPRTGKPKRPYKKRTPKLPFTPPEPALAEAWEAAKARAGEEAAAQKREAARAEAARRKRRRSAAGA